MQIVIEVETRLPDWAGSGALVLLVPRRGKGLAGKLGILSAGSS